MRILITSCGKRDYLVNWFVLAAGPKGTVHVGNSHEDSPCFALGVPHVVTPLIASPAYIPFLLDYCRENHIDLVCPLFDEDVHCLALHGDQFREQGTLVLGPQRELARLAIDKWAAHQWLTARGILTPFTAIDLKVVRSGLEREEISFPLMVKPRYGMGSIDVYIVHNWDELLQTFSFLTQRCHSPSGLTDKSGAHGGGDVLVQKRLVGDEFGVDVLNDLKGKPVAVVPKRKLSMSAGETWVAATVRSTDLHRLGMQLGEELGHVGNLDCDIFVVDGVPVVLELNVRFGGGYPFSHFSGVDFPRCIAAWLDRTPIDPRWLTYTEGVSAVKSLSVRAL